MNLRSLLRNFTRSLNDPSTSLADPANWLFTAVGTPTSTTGLTITPENSLESVPVLAAVRLLAGTLASLSLLTYRETADGKERAVTHPAYRLLKTRANPELSAFAWRELTAAHCLCFGNAYSEVERANNGSPLNLWPIYPTNVRPARIGGKLAYLVRVNGREVPVAAENILHIRGLALTPDEGLLPSTLARESLGVAKSLEKYAASFFGNGAAPSGVLSSPRTLGKQARDNLRNSWNTLYGGLSNAQRVAVLEEGLTWTPLGLTNEASQFLESRRMAVEDVARMFNIPPYMLGASVNATYASIEAQQQDFVDRAIMPLCRRFEAELNLKLFDGSPFFAEFQLNSLLRGDSQTRAQFYQTMANLGVLSVNEIRALENMNSIGPEGDVRLRPLNMTPLGQQDTQQVPTNG